MKLFWIFLVVFLPWSFEVSAENTGNELLEICEEKNDMSALGACRGYINGAAHVLSSPYLKIHLPVTICLPPTSKWSQVEDVVVNYLQSNPKNRHYSARVLIWRALQEAWPCKK